MFLVFLFLTIIFVIGLYLSSIKINVVSFKLAKLGKNFELEYKIKISFMFYGKIKIFGFTILENGISFLGNKISYKNLKKIDLIRNFFREDIIVVEKNFKMEDLKNVKIKLEEMDLSVEIGLDDILITTFTVAIISAVLAFIINSNIDKLKFDKCKYIIMPKYNCSNVFYLNMNSKISFNTVEVINLILKNKKRSILKKESKISKETKEDKIRKIFQIN